MKAAFITAPCPAEGIQFADLPQPQPRSGEVRVRVRAARRRGSERTHHRMHNIRTG